MRTWIFAPRWICSSLRAPARSRAGDRRSESRFTRIETVRHEEHEAPKVPITTNLRALRDLRGECGLGGDLECQLLPRCLVIVVDAGRRGFFRRRSNDARAGRELN